MSQGDKQYYIIEVWDVSIDRIFETGYYFVRKDQLLLVSTIECFLRFSNGTQVA